MFPDRFLGANRGKNQEGRKRHDPGILKCPIFVFDQRATKPRACDGGIIAATSSVPEGAHPSIPAFFAVKIAGMSRCDDSRQTHGVWGMAPMMYAS